jgi:hypothetical protein
LGVHLSFSLIDQVEESLLKLTRDVDQEYALRRIDNGRLRIGLTDSSTFSPFRFRQNPDVYLYVDQFESVDEILAACILSSYVPGLTGPLLEMSLRSNEAASRASRHLFKMLKRGVVKSSSSGHPVQQLHREDSQFWDGGLINMFPVIDADTCLVTPLSGNFANPSISPSTTSRKSFVTVDDQVQLQISMENAHALRCVTLSSEDHVLESWFEQGHNDALQFLTKNSGLSVYSVASSTSTDAVA